uniref:Telomeric repeat-binding factor 2 n=1 Tax=Maylandia zebra TaxID=106582 RepID=A0A3P9BTM2_9CICH
MWRRGNYRSISRQFDTESVVNRWVVDYYLFLALELFKKEQYEDFCAITDVLDSVLVRPYGPIDFMPQKIQVWRFLCRINEGDKPDTSSQSVCPLESALMLLESMSQEFSIPQQDYKNVCTSIKEMVSMFLIEVLFQRDSGSPMEASPADQPPQADAVPQTQESSLSKTTSVPWNGQLYTLSRLVMEPDSQASSQCSKVSEELETEARVEKAPQTLALSNKRDSQCPVTDQEVSIPAPKRHRRTNRINRRYLYLFFSFPGK